MCQTQNRATGSKINLYYAYKLEPEINNRDFSFPDHNITPFCEFIPIQYSTGQNIHGLCYEKL